VSYGEFPFSIRTDAFKKRETKHIASSEIVDSFPIFMELQDPPGSLDELGFSEQSKGNPPNAN
jgi:hypothetical protein